MKIIDPRSGEVMTIGKTVTYPDGEQVTLIDVDAGFFSGEALVATADRDFDGRLVLRTRWVPLTVRFMHPAFWFQRVGFLSS